MTLHDPEIPPVAGAVFDLDGTLLHNMPFHIEAFNAFAERHGLPALTLERRKWMDGKRNRDIFPGLFDRALSEDDLEAMAEEKESLYRRLSVGRLTPLTGLLRLLDLLDARGIPVAIATSAPLPNVEHTLQRARPEHDGLPVVARSDTVPRGKPFPDVFLEAARLLGVEPRACLAFEDAPAGHCRGPRRRHALRGHRDELPARGARETRTRRRTGSSPTTTSSSTAPAPGCRSSRPQANAQAAASVDRGRAPSIRCSDVDIPVKWSSAHGPCVDFRRGCRPAVRPAAMGLAHAARVSPRIIRQRSRP